MEHCAKMAKKLEILLPLHVLLQWNSGPIMKILTIV